MSGAAELARLDGIAQAELCRRGDVSPGELRTACLDRIDALNPLLRAVVTVADADEPRRRDGGGRPFEGVPFLVKDSTPWPGLRWTMGARVFARNVARAQTPYGRRLEEAGLVCVGKSALSEFGLLASTETRLFGATHNPWDLSLSAGGSSGGSAAAVAAGIVPLAHGNDGGGSIRVPASVCGVFGFKPSRGRTVAASVSNSDFMDMTSDHLLSRSVRDSALFLAITQKEQRAMVGAPLARKLRICAIERTLLGEEPEAPVRRAHAEALNLLGELGHEVDVINWPAFDAAALTDAFFVVAGAAMAGVVAMVDQARGTPVQQDELEPFSWSLVELFESRGSGALPLAREAFAGAVQAYLAATRPYDVVLTPTVGRASWPLGHLSPFLGREELLRRTGRILGYTPIQNIAGAPAMSVPLFQGESGLPIGSHLAAAPGADDLLLALAYQLEAARPWKDRWPPYSIPVLCRER